MTALHRFLEDFSATAAPDQSAAPAMSESDLEGARLESFENGYRAGWDDALAAQSDDRSRISSALAQHLQDLAFTYHEAYNNAMNAMAPLLEEVTATLLPAMARGTLGHHIVEQLQAQAREIGQMEVVIAVSEDSAAAVAPLLEQDFGFPITLQTDDTLSDEQADIRFGRTERQIDLGALVDSMAEALQGFAHETQRSVSHG